MSRCLGEGGDGMAKPKLALAFALVATLVAAIAAAAGAATTPATIPVLQDARLTRKFEAFGGATPLATSRTVTHWFGQTLDPHNGVTYGYNMVGANPNSCTGAACTVHVKVDITPIIVND